MTPCNYPSPCSLGSALMVIRELRVIKRKSPKTKSKIWFKQSPHSCHYSSIPLAKPPNHSLVPTLPAFITVEFPFEVTADGPFKADFTQVNILDRWENGNMCHKWRFTSKGLVLSPWHLSVDLASKETYSVFMFCFVFISLTLVLGEGNGIPLQYSCLENPMDGGAW